MVDWKEGAKHNKETPRARDKQDVMQSKIFKRISFIPIGRTLLVFFRVTAVAKRSEVGPFSVISVSLLNSGVHFGTVTAARMKAPL